MQIVINKLDKHFNEIEPHTVAISKLAGEIWREHYTPIIGTEQVEYMLAKFQSPEQIYKDIKKQNYIYFTAKHIDSEKIIGYSACRPEQDYLFLSKIYVHKDNRGKGIFRRFLEEIIALCRQEYDLVKIRLTVNKNNEGTIAVYKKVRFETIDSVKTNIGGGYFMDDYVMEMQIET